MYGTVDCCPFKQGQEPCGQPIYAWPWCKEHEALRTATHDFYKWVEVQWKNVDGSQSREYTFEHRHKFLLLAVSARLVHTELFYKDDKCENHALYLGGLYGLMRREEVCHAKCNKGFVVEGASYDTMILVATGSIKQAFLDWHESDKQKPISYYIRDFPRVIPRGTEVPEAVKLRMNPPEYTDW